MTFTEANAQFNAAIDLMSTTGELPASYSKVIDAVKARLRTLAAAEAAINRSRGIGADEQVPFGIV